MTRLTTIATLLCLTGCGESAGDYHRAETTRAELRHVESEAIATDDRITALEQRVKALEAGQ